MRTLVLMVAVLGCSGTTANPPAPVAATQAAPPQPVAPAPPDKCTLVFEKMAPVMRAEGASPDGPALDRDRAVGLCRKDLVEHPESEELFDCVIAIAGTATMDTVAACGREARFRKRGTRAPEAEEYLRKLGDSAVRVLANSGSFAVGTVGLTPAGDITEGCCVPANKGRCPVSSAEWQHPVWRALEFSIEEPVLNRYSYTSDGKAFEATAVGDMDCDLRTVTWRLRGRIENGRPILTLVPPPPHSD